jgi:surface protein
LLLTDYLLILAIIFSKPKLLSMKKKLSLKAILRLCYFFCFLFIFSNKIYAQNEFITVWDLSKSSNSATEIVLGVNTTGYVGYTWEEIGGSNASGSDTFSGVFTNVTISSLPANAQIRLKINGTNFGSFRTNAGVDKERLIAIEQWGNIIWDADLSNSFLGCTNLNVTATDIPNFTNVTNLSGFFSGCTSLVGNSTMNNWNVSGVNNVSYMFFGCSLYNQPLNNWNLSEVSNMESMFTNASIFNQPLDNWNVVNVSNMVRMFKGCSMFNQPLNSWIVSTVTNMRELFSGCIAFNQPLDNWNTSSVTDMDGMFADCTVFNQNLNTWDVSSVEYMGSLFVNCPAFNQPLDNWNVGAVKYMNGTFASCTSFNQDIGNWNVSSVTDMYSMFYRAASFNQLIINWNTSNVNDMSYMFWGASFFNQNVNDWNVSNVNTLAGMFLSATSFNQDLGIWNLKSGVVLSDMLVGSGLDCNNYSSTLSGWYANPSCPSNLNLIATNLKYNNTIGKDARTNLINNKGWTISGDNLNIPIHYYQDDDNDGYYGSEMDFDCVTPGEGWYIFPPSNGGGDCNDNDFNIHPNSYPITENACDSFYWSANGTTYYNSVNGITITLKDFNNCDSILTLNLTILPNYTINASSGANGFISNAGSSLVCENKNIDYTITPDVGYKIEDILVDGTSVGAVTSYTFNNVYANHTIVASFTLACVNTTSNTSLVICSSQLPYSWNGLTFATGGSQTATLVNASGCDSLATLNLTINNPNFIWSHDGISCGPGIGHLRAQANVDSFFVKWYDAPTGGNLLGTVQSLFFDTPNSDSVSTAYYAEVVSSDSLACVSTSRLQVNSIIVPIPTLSIDVDSANYCVGGSVTVNATTNGHTIIWGPDYGLNLSGSPMGSIAVINPTSSTLYEVTAYGPSDCSVKDTVNIIVRQSSLVNDSLSICATQLPYTWNGLTFNTAGTQNVSGLINAAGCDSSATYTLSVKPNYTINATANVNGSISDAGVSTICEGETKTYTISANSGFEIENVLVDGVSVGAISTHSFNIITTDHTIEAFFKCVATYYYDTTTVCALQLPYTWNGLVFNTAETQQLGGVINVNGCDSNAYFTVKLFDPAISRDSIAICSSELPYTWNGLTFNAAGTQTVSGLTSNNHCDSIATFIVSLKANYTISAVTGVNGSITDLGFSTICENENKTYTILPNSGFAIADVLVDGVSIGAVTSYTFSNVNSNHSIEVSFVASCTATSSFTDLTICPTELPYTWNGKVYVINGRFYDTIQNAAGCDSILILDLRVANLTLQADAYLQPGNIKNGVVNSTCLGNTVYLAPIAGSTLAFLYFNQLTYSCINVNAATSGLPNSVTTSSGYYPVYPTAPGVYVYQVQALRTANGCSGTATFTFTVNGGQIDSVTTCSVPYIWNGNSYSTSGVYYINKATVASNTCDSLFTLVLNVPIATTNNFTHSGCNSVVYNENIYTSSTTIIDTLKSFEGCDSMYNVHSIVVKAISATTNNFTQSGCNSVVYNGNNYTSSTTVIDTLKSFEGCDSMYNVHTINILMPTSSTDNLTICSTQLPYTWNGLTFTAAGSQTKTGLVNANGCDSSATLNLSVNPTTSSTTDLTICSTQLPYSWNGLTFTTAGTQAKTGLVNANGCDSSATLNLSVNPTTSSTTDLTICANQLPYSWNGLSFTTAGSQTKTGLVNANGCDSSATLNLSVNPTTSSTTDLTICANQLPYSWNGLTFTTAGSQTKTGLVNANGCDSIATLNLTVNAATSSTDNLTICSTQLPYTWNGLTFTAAGSQTKTGLVNANGCDSIATLNLTVNAATSSTDNLTICSTQLPYTWNGLTFTAAGSQTKTGLVNANGCDSSATLNLTVNATTSSTTDLTICSTQLPYSWNGLTFTTAGSQTKTGLVNANGCDSSATLNLSVNPTTSSTTDLTICANQLPYSWNGLTFTTAGSQTKTGLVNANGCDSIATLNLTVNAATSSTDNLTICSTQLPYTWNGLTFTAAGSQTKTGLVNANGCDSSATLNLTVNATTSSTTDLTICSTQLPYSWNGLTFTTAGSQTKTGLVNANGCDSSATLNLSVNPTTSSTTDLTICANQLPYSWNGLTFTTAGSQTKTGLVNANGCDSIATLNLTVNAATSSTDNLTICSTQLPYTWNGLTFTAAGSQTKTGLVNANGCDSIATLNLTVNAATSSTDNLTICSTQLPYTWNGLTFTAAGSQTKTGLVNANGCDSSATLNLTVNATTSSTTDLTICSTQLPYSWNGLSFTTAGSQTKTGLVNANGCDSIATLNLTVNAATSSTDNLTICSTQLPYTWNGLTFTAAGSQTKTGLVNSQGCDSSATLNLSVNPTTSSTTDLTICANQLPYSWNGLTFTTAGSQTKTGLVNANGCDSIATLNLTVNAATSSTDNLTICSTQLPYTWNGLTFTAAGSQTKTGLVNSQGCDSSATLNLSVNPTTSSTTDLTICSTQLPYSWNGLTFTTAGSQTKTGLVNANGCDSSAMLNLTVNAATSSTDNLTICSTQLPYSWNGLTFTAAGSQTKTGLVNANGCDSSATLNLTVNPTTSSTTDLTICANQLPYSWNGLTFTTAGSQTKTGLVNANGCDSSATLNLSVNPTTSSTTDLTICSTQLPYSWNGLSFTTAGSQTKTGLVNANGCDSSATLNLSVNPTTSSTTDLTICDNQLPYTWNGLTFTAAGSQTKTGLVNANGCDSSATLNLTINNTFSVNLGVDTIICRFQSYPINGSISGLSNPTYQWGSSNGFTASNASVSLSSAGKYWLRVTDATGCSNIDTMNLAVNTSPIDAELFAATQIFKNDTVTIVNISKYANDTAIWNTFSNPNILIVRRNQGYLDVVFKDTGTYQIGLTTKVGVCTQEALKTINVLPAQNYPSPTGPSRDPFIRNYVAAPNPSNGTFSVNIKLGDVSKIRLRLFSAVTNSTVSDLQFNGQKEYTIPYNLSIAKGMYILILETQKGTAVHKILIN